jgi:hypothetical protein
MSSHESDSDRVCSICYRPWQGTHPGTYHDELRQQDHKGPQDVLISNCCGRALRWGGPQSIPWPDWKPKSNVGGHE